MTRSSLRRGQFSLYDQLRATELYIVHPQADRIV